MIPEGILHNIKILDFTWVLAGPYGTRLLADYGADVVKVLPPNMMLAEDAFSNAYYQTWNRNKRGVALDLNTPEGLIKVKELITKSDVIIENFTPRVMSNWGLDYENLKSIKPDIIMVSLSAYGQTGPDRDHAGFAPTVHAASGLTGLMRTADGEPCGPGFSWADHVAGLYAAMAVLAALEHRDMTGEGQYVDISETECVISLLGGELLDYQLTGSVGKPEDVAAAVIRDAADLFRDEQLRERGFFLDRANIGPLVDANPIRMSVAEATYRTEAPSVDAVHRAGLQ